MSFDEMNEYLAQTEDSPNASGEDYHTDNHVNGHTDHT